MTIRQGDIREILRSNGETLYHREDEKLEFKEQFSFARLADYLKDFAAFANNQGGYLVFGVTDSPWMFQGLNPKSIERFQKIDPAKITGYLLEIFSSEIRWTQTDFEMDGKICGVFKIEEALTKPIIAKKNEDSIKEGEIYYRYAGRTQKIQPAELEAIIQQRIQENNEQWRNLMSKIAEIGPQNVAILDTEKWRIEAGGSQILTIDEKLTKKLQFIKDGHFSTEEGSTVLKVVGDVVPILGVIQEGTENLLAKYHLSARELANEVKRQLPSIGKNKVWKTIKDNAMKVNPEYSVYNFRNKKQEDRYKESGHLPSGTPSIYNQKAVDFIVGILKVQESSPQAGEPDP